MFEHKNPNGHPFAYGGKAGQIKTEEREDRFVKEGKAEDIEKKEEKKIEVNKYSGRKKKRY